jgi:hypothetical protein
MSVHIRLIGLAPLGMTRFVMQRVGAALRERHLGQLDVIDLHGDATSRGTPRERCPIEKLVLDEYEAETLLERAGIDLAPAGAPSGRRTPKPVWFEVHLLMKMDLDSGRPADEGALNDVCRLIVQRMPNVHLWYGCFGDETEDYVHLARWDVEKLPDLPFEATGPGTRLGDTVLMLLRGTIVRHSSQHAKIGLSP